MGEHLHSSPPASAPSTPPSTHITYPTLPQLPLPQWSDPNYVYSYTLHSELVKPARPAAPESENSFGLSDISRANCGAKDATYRSAAIITMNSGTNSGPVGYGTADNMSSRVKRYYRNSFPRVEERPVVPNLTTSLIAAGLRFEADPNTASVSEPTSSSEAAKVERYYRDRVTRKPATPNSAKGGLEAVSWFSEPVEVLTSSSGSTSTSQSPRSTPTSSTSPTLSQQSTGEKQPEMMENDEKACVIY